ncbi:MAG: DUF3575 domain-containing protein [Saprospiraceae bacterium]
MMKNLIMILTVVLISEYYISAQQNVLKMNPLGFAFGIYNLTYERALGPATSFQVGGRFFTKLFGLDVSSFGLDADFKYYITHKKKPSPEGFYIGPGISFNKTSYNEFSDATATTFGIGGTVGYQWIWNSGFALDLGIGPKYLTIITSSDDLEGESISGVVPNLSFAIGYAF